MASASDPIRTCADVQRLFAYLADQPREIVAVAYLDRDWRVLALRHGPVGGPDAAVVPLRKIARDAVVFDAVRVVMAHNHPSGDPRPSRADIRVTRQLAHALAALEAPLVEHLVLGRGGGLTSLAGAGIL